MTNSDTFDFTNGIVAILSKSGRAVGTGFVVHEDGLIATCAHVVEDVLGTDTGPGHRVQVQFHSDSQIHSTMVTTWWQDKTEGDIAILQLINRPQDMVALPLSASITTSGNATRTFGYPRAGEVKGLWGRGEVLGLVSENGGQRLQLSSKEITNGFSGGPVWDEKGQRVIGMVTSGINPERSGRLRDIALATPAETLITVCPELVLTEPQVLSEEKVRLSKQEWRERKKQLILLDKVQQFWVDGYLAHSVPEDRLIQLEQESYLEAIDHPWHEVVGTAVYDQYTLDTSLEIHEIFSESDRALLILGEPGAGKTITLIKLAQALISHSQKDVTQPIPVVLNLATWGETQLPLMDWAVEELTVKYQIPRQMSRPWLEKDELLLLLDGLDEVPANLRDDCIQAINKFRHSQGLTGVVVCCRLQEYEANQTKLKLGGAILLKTLTSKQIESYLDQADGASEKLRHLLQQDNDLLEIAQSPLLLQLMQRVYAHADDTLPTTLLEQDNTNPRQQLFTTYVTQQLQQVKVGSQYSPTQIKSWLTWLAQQMNQHNQAIFFLEKMQPSWLPNRWWRCTYILLTRLFGSIALTIVEWTIILGLTLGSLFAYQFSEGSFFAHLAQLLDIPLPYAILITLLSVNVSLSLILGLIDIYRLERAAMVTTPITFDTAKQWSYGLGLGLGGTGLGCLIFLPYDGLIVYILAWVFSGILTMLGLSLAVYAPHYRADIRLIEAVQWSGRAAWRGFPLALASGFILGIVGWLVYADFQSAWVAGMSFFVPVLFILGLVPQKIEKTIQPNQGIKLSARNSLVVALYGQLITGFLFIIANDIGLGLSLVIGTGIGFAFLFGAFTVSQHLILRLILIYTNHIPQRYVQFLDQAAKMAILHKVGGGYVFFHRLLQDYFASLSAEGDEIN